MEQIKFFGKWSSDDIKVDDPGLVKYISLEPRHFPKTGARYVGNRFHKSKISIVERLINKVMNPGHRAKKHKISSGRCTGKAHTASDIVEDTLTIIEQRLKLNPVAVLVKSIENSAPREEIISIEYGGARYPKAVESSPLRRIDYVLRQMTQGAYQKSFNSKKKISVCLADEIIAAFNLQQNSAAVSKKLELERQADSAR
jgi:small subunit ribosomal protein S7